MHMKRLMAYIVMLIVVVSFFFPYAVSAQSITQLEEELAELEAEKNTIDRNASNAEQKLKENEQRQAEVNAEINNITNELEVTEANLVDKQVEINETSQQIDSIESSIRKREIEIELTEEEIVGLNAEIDDLITRIAERDDLIKNRMRSIQQNGGDVNYLQVIFGSQSFGDFINRVAALTRIIEQDQWIIESQQADQVDLENMRVEVEEKQNKLIVDKENLEDDKNELDRQRTNLVAQEKELINLQAQLNEQMDEQSNLLVTLEEEFEELEDYQVTLADLQEIQRREVTALQRAIELAREQERGGQGVGQLSQDRSGGGRAVLAWPASTRRVTSPYGYRTHPISGRRSFHNGIDIADPGYQEIYAAEAGVVTATFTEHDGRMNGYGDAIMITHYIDMNGDGNRQQVTTLYSHLRSGTTLVRAGDQVQRGQQIATMGNTGNSTAQHLDFEVHIGTWNGRANSVNPMDYLN